jgi:hypothetical protein
MAAHPTDVGLLSVDRSWQRMAVAPAVVRAERDGDLLHADYGLVEITALYRCLDKLLEHKTALFDHLRQRWQDPFGAGFGVLLYDLTSTYFGSSPPDDENDKRRYGYSRDKRSDCVQVVIALIVTPDGFPLAYEVLPGNTADCTTLRNALRKIEAQYGKADRIWILDRGIPSNEVLAEMRKADPLSRISSARPRPAFQTGEGAAQTPLAGGSRGGRCQASPAGRGDVRAGAEPRTHRQGTRHAALVERRSERRLRNRLSIWRWYKRD